MRFLLEYIMLIRTKRLYIKMGVVECERCGYTAAAFMTKDDVILIKCRRCGLRVATEEPRWLLW